MNTERTTNLGIGGSLTEKAENYGAVWVEDVRAGSLGKKMVPAIPQSHGMDAQDGGCLRRRPSAQRFTNQVFGQRCDGGVTRRPWWGRRTTVRGPVAGRVVGHVGRRAHQLEVLETVVRLLVVLVVDHLVRLEKAPEVKLHQEPMLRHEPGRVRPRMGRAQLADVASHRPAGAGPIPIPARNVIYWQTYETVNFYRHT